MTMDKGKAKLFFVFLFPALLIYLIFVIYPIFSTLYYSFFEWTGLNDSKVFIGIQNYIQLSKDAAFRESIINNLYVILASVFIQIPLGLILALVITRTNKRAKLYSIIYFIPFLMSTVSIGLIWTFLYDPMIGVINQVLAGLGFDISAFLWLGDPNSALSSVLVVVIWNYAPFYMIMFKAAMSTIPEEYYEAISIDGASTAQKFTNITLPLLIPSIISSIVLSIVGSLKTFDLFYIMTKGGPGSSTELMGTYMYKQGFTYFKMGYASSAAFTMFFLSVLSIFFIRYIQNKLRKEASY